MSKGLSLTGVVLTLIYLYVIYFLIGARIPELYSLELNEVGDFLAGVFGPLAVMWLILGFFQQGVELRQGTQALKLQADELKNSVAQQSNLVELSREQLRAAQEEMERQRRLTELAAEPHINLVCQGSIVKNGNQIFSFQISNTGARCTNLDLFIPLSGTNVQYISHYDVFDSKSIQFQLSEKLLPLNNHVNLEMSYTRSTGERGHQKKNIQRIKAGDGITRVLIHMA